MTEQHDPTEPEEDPHRWISTSSLFSIFVPFSSMRGPDRGLSGLGLLRQVFVSFCVALAMIGAVLAFLLARDSPTDPPSAPLVTVGVAAIGLLSLLAPALVLPGLDCTSDARLVASYRTQFFVRLAFAEAGALIGFVGSIVTASWWPFFAGVAISAIGFGRAAPSDQNLEALDEELRREGCPRSLPDLLRGSRLGPPGVSDGPSDI